MFVSLPSRERVRVGSEGEAGSYSVRFRSEMLVSVSLRCRFRVHLVGISVLFSLSIDARGIEHVSLLDIAVE